MIGWSKTSTTALRRALLPSSTTRIGLCGPANPTTPGASGTATGPPFNPSGHAGVVYAGNPNTASLAHANSTAAVSQYDAACVRLSH